MFSENPNASSAGRHANLSMGGGPHMRIRVSAPGSGMCSDTIWRVRVRTNTREETVRGTAGESNVNALRSLLLRMAAIPVAGAAANLIWVRVCVGSCIHCACSCRRVPRLGPKDPKSANRAHTCLQHSRPRKWDTQRQLPPLERSMMAIHTIQKQQEYHVTPLLMKPWLCVHPAGAVSSV